MATGDGREGGVGGGGGGGVHNEHPNNWKSRKRDAAPPRPSLAGVWWAAGSAAAHLRRASGTGCVACRGQSHQPPAPPPHTEHAEVHTRRWGGLRASTCKTLAANNDWAHKTTAE